MISLFLDVNRLDGIPRIPLASNEERIGRYRRVIVEINSPPSPASNPNQLTVDSFFYFVFNRKFQTNGNGQEGKS